MSPRVRSAVLLGVVVLMLLAGYLLQKLEDAPPSGVPGSELTPAPTSTGAAGTTTASAVSPGPTMVRDLSLDEAQGGHTLERHVGKSDAELAARLKAEPDISAASSYFDRTTAERSVSAVLVKKAAEMEKWERKTGSRANLALRLDLGETVGRSLKRGQSKAVDVDAVVVVLRWDDGDWYVLTSYPEDR